jgi:hypothetical protein
MSAKWSRLRATPMPDSSLTLPPHPAELARQGVATANVHTAMSA